MPVDFSSFRGRISKPIPAKNAVARRPHDAALNFQTSRLALQVLCAAKPDAVIYKVTP
jgi:hypothetical protein